ncbi:MAG: cyclic nucleotide-binding domain-containing protein [Rhabdochlamydiaceae bacterium]
MNSDDFVQFCSKLKLFEDFSEQDIADIYPYAEIKKIPKKELIVEEKSASEQLFIIVEGEASIFKWSLENGCKIQLKQLSKGEMIGEMGFIDNAPRSAHVEALSDCTLIIFDKRKLPTNEGKEKKIYHQMIANIAKITVPRLRQMNEDFILSKESEMKKIQMQNKFGQFFIWVIVFLGLSSILESFAKEGLLDSKSRLFHWLYILVVFIPFLIVMRVFNFSLKEAGVGFSNWKKSVMDGLLASLGLIFIFYFLEESISKFLSNYIKLNPLTLREGIQLPYLLSSYIQEFVCRGIGQSVLQRFYNNDKGVLPILISSVVFAVLHLHISLIAGLIVFIASLLFGLLYIQSYNLIGVSIFHFSLGTMAGILGVF